MHCDKCGQKILTRFTTDYESCKQQNILNIVMEYFDIDTNYLVKKERSRQRVYVRQIVCYFLRDKTGMTITNIGRMFGQDHTTVLYSLQKLKDLVSIYEPIQRDIEEINKILTIQEHPLNSD